MIEFLALPALGTSAFAQGTPTPSEAAKTDPRHAGLFCVDRHQIDA